jgi:hypothetical protein
MAQMTAFAGDFWALAADLAFFLLKCADEPPLSIRGRHAE